MKRIYSKKQKRKKRIIRIISLILICTLANSAYHLITWKENTTRNKIIKENTNKVVKIKKDSSETKEKIEVNWSDIKKTNKDSVAYLKINNTNINYIVVKGKDNEYYLNHNINNQKNIAGWIFADYKNKLDGSDKNIVIYGHNIVDKSMFGSIPDMFKKEWYNNETNLNISFVTEKGDFAYHIFSMYTVKAEEYYIQTDFKDNSSYQEFLKTIKKRSFYHFKEEIVSEDFILTLSTCTPDGNARMVIHAKLINQ